MGRIYPGAMPCCENGVFYETDWEQSDRAREAPWISLHGVPEQAIQGRRHVRVARASPRARIPEGPRGGDCVSNLPLPMKRWQPKPREPRDPRFKDPRSRVLWRSGRVILKGQDMTALRWEVYHRAQGRCEVKANGRRCNKFAPFDGFGHGELAHLDARGRGGSDTPQNTCWACRDCHRERLHVGPQFAPQRRRRAEAGANSEGPGEPVYGVSDGR